MVVAAGKTRTEPVRGWDPNPGSIETAFAFVVDQLRVTGVAGEFTTFGVAVKREMTGFEPGYADVTDTVTELLVDPAEFAPVILYSVVAVG